MAAPVARHHAAACLLALGCSLTGCEPASTSREPDAGASTNPEGDGQQRRTIGEATPSRAASSDAVSGRHDETGSTPGDGAAPPKGAETPTDRPSSPAAAEPLRTPNGAEMTPCPAKIPDDMACIPGGPFLRGSDDGPAHARPRAEVWISTFLMDRNEVTVEAWKACVAEKNCPQEGPQYVDFDRPRQPINGITWFGARSFCESVGKRLPTEAEWEKAARGTDGRTYPWGEDPASCELAVFKDPKLGRGCGLLKAGKDPAVGRPDLVGSRPPNPYGLYDMAGNSWEWVADWWSKSYEACGEDCLGVDPKGPCGGAETCPSTGQKIVRGGSWFWDAEHMTTFRRRAHFPANEPFHHFGFRCAASLDAAPG